MMLARANSSVQLTRCTEFAEGPRKSPLDDTRKGPPDDVAGVKDGRYGDNFSFL
jgi:hypothetical protein